MKRLGSFKWRLRTGALVALVTAAALGASLTLVIGANTKPEKKAGNKQQTVAKADPKPVSHKTARKAKKKVVKRLSGATLYAINCNRCHPERYPTEWTASQWKTIMMHMRVRANLPAVQARAILRYLQADAGQ